MAQELQALLDKIQTEGVEKANEKAKAVIETAEKIAAEKIAAAEKKAAEIRAQAEADSAILRERAEQAVRQAARDIVLETGRKVQSTLERVLLADTEAALSGDYLKTFLETIVKAMASHEGADGIEVIAPPAQAAELASFARAKFASSVKGGLKISSANDVKAGIRVVVDNGRVEHDFTSTALIEAMSRLMSPSLSAMIFAK